MDGVEWIGSVVFIDDLTEVRSSLINSELSAQIQTNSAKVIGQQFVEKMDSDLKYGKMKNGNFCNESKNLSPIQLYFTC